MKQLLICTLFILHFSFGAQAQAGNDGADNANRKEKIEKVIIAMVTKRLDLTVEEAQLFWPTFNKFRVDMKAAVTPVKDDEIKKNEAIIGVQKKYKPQFQKILGTEERANKVFKIFNEMTARLKQMQERKNNPPKGPRRQGGSNTN
jgi:phosphotransferase system IIB component